MYSRFGTLLLAVLTINCTTFDEGRPVASVQYEIIVDDPSTGSFLVNMNIGGVQRPFSVALPRSTPGGLTQNNAKYLSDFRVTDGNDIALTVAREGPHRWRIEPESSSEIKIEYRISRNEDDRLRLVTNWLTERGGFFHGTTLFLFPVEARDVPVEISFSLPVGWRVVTPLVAKHDGKYRAPSYDDVAQSPFEIGQPTEQVLEIEDVRLRLCFDSPLPTYDSDELSRRLTDIVRHHVRLFGGAPFKELLVLFHWRPDLDYGGGVARREVLVINIGKEWMEDLPRNLAGTFAHELFHTWNFAAFHPRDGNPYDYLGANGSKFHWFIEGADNYYVMLTFARMWGLEESRFIALMEGAANSLEQSPGFQKISLADAGVASWIEPLEWVNLAEGGQAIAFALDLEIRRSSDNRYSLDDFMRILYQESQKPGYQGYTQAEFAAALSAVATIDMEGFLRKHVYGTESVDYSELLPIVGGIARRNEGGRWQFEIDEYSAEDPSATLRALLSFQDG